MAYCFTNIFLVDSCVTLWLFAAGLSLCFALFVGLSCLVDPVQYCGHSVGIMDGLAHDGFFFSHL